MPLVTVAVTLIAAFPVFSEFSTQLKVFLLTNMVPEIAGKIITQHMQQFADNAARLTAVGISFLAVTALTMMFTIDRAFNAIWRVSRPRPMLQRLLIYWAVLTVGPLLMGASLSLTSWLVSLSLGLVKGLPALGVVLLKVTPVVLTVAAFTALYITVPNRYVPPLRALTGGLAGAAAFEIMKRASASRDLLSHLQPGLRAFATIPIFLLWIYLSGWWCCWGRERRRFQLGAGRPTVVSSSRFADALRIRTARGTQNRAGEDLH